MSLDTGARLGPYEISAPLGAGGMGEVYRARDTRLGRTVAIKVLPSDLAPSVERKRRFEREARAISSLQHPNRSHQRLKQYLEFAASSALVASAPGRTARLRSKALRRPATL
jgi:serine/threonine protein kinase